MLYTLHIPQFIKYHTSKIEFKFIHIIYRGSTDIKGNIVFLTVQKPY